MNKLFKQQVSNHGVESIIPGLAGLMVRDRALAGVPHLIQSI
jgi:hypothetical protein